ncbi:MAG: hybrid sensor histidine kinase/response regulator [Betaproteobacteria bacterium]|nr:hybrid sensor histidine kinase/response regulator [Betaproteobacteria bacterium]
MAKKNDEFAKRLLATFRVEADEHLKVMSSGIVELERAPTAQEQIKLIETVFREAHSLKGAARAVGLAEIESICQAAESVFSALKRNELAFSPGLFDMLHDAVDALDKLLRSVGVEPSGGEKVPIAELIRRLESVGKGVAAPFVQTAAQADAGASLHSRQQPHPALPAEKAVLADTVRIATARLDALLFQAEELLSAKLTSAQRTADVRAALDELAALKKEWSKSMPGMKVLQHALQKEAKRTGPGRRTDPHLRKLLEFMAWENDFVKSFETRLAALGRTAEHDQRSLGVMLDGLLDDMKKALMMPISSALEIFPKFVRDLSRDQGKEVELVIRGGEIEIDRRILQEMRDPLIHLVRNCMDHGIEAREERQRRSKAPRGTIALTVTQKSEGKIEIAIADDGAGIDTEKVRIAALKLGMVSPEDAEGRSEPEWLPLVFQSGLSTSPIITDISGRGLGLAIVREKVERLGGGVSVETQPGSGTTFRVVVPLTLATFRGVHVRVGDHRFVIPTTYVEQAARLKREEIKTAENRETVRWNGQAVALARLADVLELPRKKSIDAPGDIVKVVLLGAANRRIAFLVDEILDEQEVLLKPLGKQLSRVRNISGATVLGTGKAVPILDVPDLLKSAARAASAPLETETGGEQIVAERESILVAEDSITARTLLKNILETAGYRVSTAVDGIDAYTLLKTERFDIVVSDVDMPRMSGFDLTAKIRADKTLSELPVVLVTALESREHRERGIDVGANAYIVKSSFDQSNLLEVIRKLL